jgi:2-keto-3-deoxy-L-rhamnonate aldolase RhmA
MPEGTSPKPGFWIARPDITALEIAAALGYRVAIIDIEHGAIAERDCDALVSLARALGLSVIVRVSEARAILVQQALDGGAHGVMLPMIRNAAHAAEASRAAKYPPLGTRGVGSGRAFGYGIYHAVAAGFHERTNAATRCHVMIETAGALEDVEAIAALPSVDGLFVGPSDLSLARGRGPFRFTSEDESDFARVAEACRAHGKDLGFPAPTAKAVAFARAQGADYVTVSDDLTALRLGLAKGLAALDTGEA